MEYTLYVGVVSATAVCYIYRRSILKFATPYILSQIGIAMADNKSSSTIENNILNIEYSVDNSKYNLHLPYNRRKRVPMINLTVVAHFANGSEKNITQQPGVPYLFSPEMIGADFIVIKNCVNDKTIIYNKEEIIGFAERAL